MVLLPVLVVLAAAAVVAGAVHLALGGGAGRVIVALTGALLLGGVLVMLIGGFGTGDEQDGRPAGEAAVPSRSSAPPPLRPPSVRLFATDPDALPPVPAVVGELEPGTAMVIGVSGLKVGSTATVHQCPSGAVTAIDCRPGVAFTVGEQGHATVVVDLERRFDVGSSGTEGVDCSGTECSVVVFGSSRLELVTVFGEAAPPPAVIGSDPRRVPPGGTVKVTASGLPPGAAARFVVCRPGGEADADCGPPTQAVRVAADGTASDRVTVSPGRCPRGEVCAVAVVLGDGGPRAFARLHLTGRDAGYDGRRVALGMAIAGLLLAVALALLVLTDWTSVEGDPFAGIHLPEDPFADVDGA